MLILKEANWEDIEKEHAYIAALPQNESGFTNSHHGVSMEDFKNRVLPTMLDHAQGIDLPEGFVPCTEYFLWDGDEIVGLFRIRHILNDALRNGAGHIGYGVGRAYRGRGYATEGLRLTLEKARELVPDDEIYMSVHKDNPASLKVQLNNGAYIHHEDDVEYYTRIRK